MFCFLIRVLLIRCVCFVKIRWATQFGCVYFSVYVLHFNKKFTEMKKNYNKNSLSLTFSYLFVKYRGKKAESKSWVHLHLSQVWWIHSRQVKQDNYCLKEATGLSFITEHYLVQIHSIGTGCATAVKKCFHVRIKLWALWAQQTTWPTISVRLDIITQEQTVSLKPG